jgi:phage shock protein PspC (stress-responsive transcriptional regulator)
MLMGGYCSTSGFPEGIAVELEVSRWLVSYVRIIVPVMPMGISVYHGRAKV